jgi:hypothetical protein
MQRWKYCAIHEAYRRLSRSHLSGRSWAEAASEREALSYGRFGSVGRKMVRLFVGFNGPNRPDDGTKPTRGAFILRKLPETAFWSPQSGVKQRWGLLLYGT